MGFCAPIHATVNGGCHLAHGGATSFTSLLMPPLDLKCRQTFTMTWPNSLTLEWCRPPTGGDAVQAGLIWVVGGGDARHVGAM